MSASWSARSEASGRKDTLKRSDSHCSESCWEPEPEGRSGCHRIRSPMNAGMPSSTSQLVRGRAPRIWSRMSSIVVCPRQATSRTTSNTLAASVGASPGFGARLARCSQASPGVISGACVAASSRLAGASSLCSTEFNRLAPAGCANGNGSCAAFAPSVEHDACSCPCRASETSKGTSSRSSTRVRLGLRSGAASNKADETHACSSPIVAPSSQSGPSSGSSSLS